MGCWARALPPLWVPQGQPRQREHIEHVQVVGLEGDGKGEHVEVAQAVLDHDVEAAVAAYRRHLEHVRDTTVQSMASARKGS